eukprot:m.56630 g.56630  ORF g.56630 m.56630 type:complete len:565 (+) comp22271_c0_seq1:213-1907(+)
MKLDAIQVLVVDDDEDIRSATKLSLKRKTYRDKKFELTFAESRAAAEAIIAETPLRFHVMLVDVVMETDDAGLQLCDFIRKNCPSYCRIILRTGQPGHAPEQDVLERYDIDHYLSKVHADEANLYAIVRSSTKTSIDLLTLANYQTILLELSEMYTIAKTVDDLKAVLKRNIDFIGAKHTTQVILFTDTNALAGKENIVVTDDVTEELIATAIKAVTTSLTQKVSEESTVKISVDDSTVVLRDLGGDLNASAIFTVADKGKTVRMGADLDACLENWKIGRSAIAGRELKNQQEEIERQLYIEKLENISMMVAGVAHEVNTPLGVAITATSMLQTLQKELPKFDTLNKFVKEELMEDIDEAIGLVIRNVKRAANLVQSFKKLSTQQMVDQRQNCDLLEIVNDVIETFKPELKKKLIVVNVDPPISDQIKSGSIGKQKVFPWDGFPGHLSQVLLNFFQNTNRYGYPDTRNETIDIRIYLEHNPLKNTNHYVIEFEDYGKGMKPEICKQMFDPFFTTGRGSGGTGLGMAIVQNLILQKLHGDITAKSAEGKGTKLKVTLPQVVPEGN